LRRPIRTFFASLHSCFVLGRLFSLNAADHCRTHCPLCPNELVQQNSDLPTLTCQSCNKRYVIVSREAVADLSYVDPQFELKELRDSPYDDEFSGDSVLSIGSPGPIDVQSSEGTHCIVTSGASAHESIVLRTRSSQPFCFENVADNSSLSLASEEFVDEALSHTFLVKASSSSVKAGLAAVSSSSSREASVDSVPADPDTVHVEEVLEYLRSFVVNEDSHVLPYLHSPSKALPLNSVRAIIRRALELFAAEPRVLTVSGNVRIFSDIHGNFKDLLIWQRLFWPDGVASLEGSVLWLGDYVDRGLNSVEVLLYMLAQKVVARPASSASSQFISDASNPLSIISPTCL
jgi:hypothetical protein